MNPSTSASGAKAPDEMSVLVSRWQQGDGTARDALIARLLPELRPLAERALRRLGQAVSLHPSDLVQESAIKLLRSGEGSVDSAHLRALAASIVGKTLIDYQRVRMADKRGRRETDNVSITVINGLIDAEPARIDVLALHEAMRKLESSSPRAARIVEMRVLGGMTEDEVATVLGVSRPTVSRDWATARLWLMRELRGAGSRTAGDTTDLRSE